MEHKKPQKQEKTGLTTYETSPAVLWDNLNPVKLDDIAVSPFRGISGIAKDLGDNGSIYVNALLTEAVIELAEFYNVTNNFSKRQVVLTVNLIREKFYFLKPDDFKLCFKNIMKGEYGKVFNRLDGGMILEFLDRYVADRMDFFEQLNENHALRHKEVRDTTVSSSDTEFHQVKVERFRKETKDGAP